MAISLNNIVTSGLVGKLANLVYRRRAGKTVVSKYPKPCSVPATPRKQRTRTRFREAVVFGKSVIANPELTALYMRVKKKHQSAYTAAISDFMNAPVIQSIETRGYSGKPGESIRVFASDAYGLASVTVSIFTSDGTELERGPAQIESKWHSVYTTTAFNESIAGARIVVTAADLPGNVTTKEQLL